MKSVCLSGSAAKKKERMVSSPRYNNWERGRAEQPAPTSDKMIASFHERPRANTKTEIESLLLYSSSQLKLGQETPTMNQAGLNSTSKSNLHLLSELKRDYFEAYGSEMSQQSIQRNQTPIMEQRFGDLWKANSIDTINLTGIDSERLSEYSLKISSSEKDIDKIRHIVEALKSEEASLPKDQYEGVKRDFSKVICSYVRFQNQLAKEQMQQNLKTSQEICSKVEQQDLVLKQIQRMNEEKDRLILQLNNQIKKRGQIEAKLFSELESCRRMNFELCKQNILLNQEITGLKKENDSLNNKVKEIQLQQKSSLMYQDKPPQFWYQKSCLNRSFYENSENILNPQKMYLEQTSNQSQADSNASTISKTRKYDSIVMKLVDQNRSLKVVIGSQNEQIVQQQKQVQLQQKAAQQLVVEAKILRQTIQKIIRKQGVVSPRNLDPCNTSELGNIRSSLRDLASKIDILNNEAHPK